MSPNPPELVETPKSDYREARKRKRERRIAVLLTLVFVLTTSVQVFFTDRAQGFGLPQSLLYFGLLYFNVILIMVLVFLISRNLIRAYLARKSGSLGGGLRWRLVSSLLAFSLVPSIVLFVASSYVIRQGFDRWFGGQVSNALEDSQAIADVHYRGIEANLEFFTKRASDKIASLKRLPTEETLVAFLNEFPVEAIELYPNLLHAPLRALREGIPSWSIPRAATESLESAFKGSSFNLIRQYGDGDLVQRYQRVKLAEPYVEDYVLVLSYTVPLGLKTRIAELKNSFLGYQQTRLLKDSLKTNYTLILLTFFVSILFVATWSGLYLARSIIEPVSELLKGTEAFRQGKWDYRIETVWNPQKKKLGSSSGADLEVLKSAFNLMAEEVGRKSRQIEEANAQLVSLVRDLEERERYLENLLSSIRRGVVVIGPDRTLQRVNEEALEYSYQSEKGEDAKWEIEEALGRPFREIFPLFGEADEVETWFEKIKMASGTSVDKIFELRQGAGRSSSLQSVRATGIWIVDEYDQPLGWLVILEDVTDAARLERMVAWQEVARRVAHEIKNPLTPIQISADRLRRRLLPELESDAQKGPLLEECLTQISKQVRVIRDLVREFSDFAKLPEPKFEPLLLKDIFAAHIQDYRFTHPQVQFSLEVEASVETAQVRADKEYLRRLFVNLADNALQGMEQAETPSPRFSVKIEPAAPESSMLRVIFEDNGPGIPESMREKIFDPYVTSKASGLGLGLAIVRRIAMEHLGRVRCEAAEGARFVLEVPILRGENQVHL
jgi:two-component system nitrogen regulation sensor histidine kinase NtrY